MAGKEEQAFGKLRLNGIGLERSLATCICKVTSKPVRPELVEGLPFCSPQQVTFWCYMLHCAGGAFYVGHTDDLDRRIVEHMSGAFPGFTRDRLPVVLVWSEAFPTRIEALESERRIKGWGRAKKLALIRGDWDRIGALAKGKNRPSTSSGQTG